MLGFHLEEEGRSLSVIPGIGTKISGHIEKENQDTAR